MFKFVKKFFMISWISVFFWFIGVLWWKFNFNVVNGKMSIVSIFLFVSEGINKNKWLINDVWKYYEIYFDVFVL